ncbi:MAG: hypothetical protein N3G80_00665 [Candidatus Micrarchaeota archaeon]|nr:hypothetical protein [Candidatus Micrarchaeota archaeon]
MSVQKNVVRCGVQEKNVVQNGQHENQQPGCKNNGLLSKAPMLDSLVLAEKKSQQDEKHAKKSPKEKEDWELTAEDKYYLRGWG